MSEYAILLDSQTNKNWILSDRDGTVLTATAVGTIGQIATTVGRQVSIQTEALTAIVDQIDALRDGMSDFALAAYPAMQIIDNRIRPPADVDVLPLIGEGINLFQASPQTIDKLVALAKWVEQYFGPWLGEDSQLTKFVTQRVTYRLPGSSTDSSMLLVGLPPTPTVPAGSVPRDANGNVVTNQPFFIEGTTGTFMMVLNNGAPVQVAVSGLDRVFDRVVSQEFYLNSFAELAVARSVKANQQLQKDNIAVVNSDVTAWRFSTDASTAPVKYSLNPPVDIDKDRLASANYVPGTLLRATKDGVVTYHLLESPKTDAANAVTREVTLVDAGTTFLIAPKESSLQGIRGQYGDQVVKLTQRSSQQSVYLNELMQKMTMHFDFASNVLKTLSESANRVAAGI